MEQQFHITSGTSKAIFISYNYIILIILVGKLLLI